MGDLTRRYQITLSLSQDRISSWRSSILLVLLVIDNLGRNPLVPRSVEVLWLLRTTSVRATAVPSVGGTILLVQGVPEKTFS